MKFGRLLLSSSAFFAVAHAAGFSYSAGWTPGQETKKPAPTATAAYTPEQTQQPGTGAKQSWVSSLLTSGPLGSLLSKAGVNLTDKLAEAEQRAQLPWDERIPMITDANYEELIFNETFTSPEEEKERVWFLVVTVTATQRTGVSAFVDEQFNEAYNTSLIEGDLPYVRWGRIDYLNVTRLTTKWAVWQAPMLIVAKDRGKSLRFFRPQQIGGRADTQRAFLLSKAYEHVPAWGGVWAPGGSREHLLDRFAVFQEHLYFYVSKVPRWLLLIISGGFGSVLLNILHRPKKNAAPAKKAVESKPKDSTLTPAPETKSYAKAVTSNVETKKAGGSQKRKGNKK